MNIAPVSTSLMSDANNVRAEIMLHSWSADAETSLNAGALLLLNYDKPSCSLEEEFFTLSIEMPSLRGESSS